MSKLLLAGLEVGPFMSNCYIVGEEESRKGMVIDPGAEADTILEEVGRMGLQIELIVLTHAHTDHVSAVAPVKEATHASFLAHREEMPVIQGGGSRMAAMLGVRFPPPPAPDRFLEGGDRVEVGGLSFLVLHTPGHSPGGICLYGHGVVFTGDTLFNLSIGRFDMPGGDGHLLVRNIHTKLMVLPDDTIVYPGHGPRTTIATEKRWNPFLRDLPGIL